MIKNEKGITLVVLAITIIVMTILATVVTYSALDSLRTAQKNAFISEMEMVQAKVNVIYEKMQNNTQDIEYYNSLGQDVSVLGEETLIKILGDSSRDGFKYFSKEDLKNLELEDINQEVIINFSTREVISTRGIKIGGVMYYKLSNIPNYKGHNIDYINKNTEAPTFEVEQTKLESGWKFTIKNIKYNSNVEGGTLSYKLHNDTNWIIAGQDTSFIATKPGIYDIKSVRRFVKGRIEEKKEGNIPLINFKAILHNIGEQMKNTGKFPTTRTLQSIGREMVTPSLEMEANKGGR